MIIRSLTRVSPTIPRPQACVVAVNALSAFTDLSAIPSTSDWATVSLLWLLLAFMLAISQSDCFRCLAGSNLVKEKGKRGGEGEGEDEDEREGKGRARCSRGPFWWRAAVVCIANGLYLSASLYALTGPEDFQVWFVLFFYVLPVVALVSYEPLVTKHWTALVLATLAGRVVIIGVGIILGWLVCGSAVGQFVKVFLDAVESGPWCEVSVQSHILLHLFVNLLSTVALAR